jgi:tRNA (guanine-N7-)-methyltransferase
MGQKKLQRFEEIKSFYNVLEYPLDMRGKWSTHFANNNPVILELACGKGEYTIGLANLYPDINFVGVDIKGNRIWRGAKEAMEKKLGNVAFLRTEIEQINRYFAPDEVSAIWITFPDPQLSKWKKRLTHPRYLRLYQQFVKNDALIHLKTDSPVLYDFTKSVINLFSLELLEDIDHVHAYYEASAELKIKTHYESLNLSGSGRVYYLNWKLPAEILADKDAILKDTKNESRIS